MSLISIIKNWFLVLVIIAFCAISCSENPAESPSIKSQPRTYSFNKQDKYIKTNGNLKTAIAMYTENPQLKVDETVLSNKAINAGEISRKVFSAIGREYKLVGRVYNISEEADSWTEMLLQVRDPNSSFGLVTVDFLCKANCADIKNNTLVEIIGYVMGVDEGENAFGGKISNIIMVGNSAQPIKRR